MQNFIEYIDIENFKSIRKLKLEGLKRINLFIGKPNVGKSNILEAFGLFSLPFIKYSTNKSISNFIRCNNVPEIFFDGITDNSIKIRTNLGNCKIHTNEKNILGLDLGENSVGHATISNKNVEIEIECIANNFSFKLDKDLKLKGIGGESPIKIYYFKDIQSKKKNGIHYFLPPLGHNIMNILENDQSLKKEIALLFSEYGLSFVLDRSSGELKVSKPPKNNEIFLIPFSSIADTLQRVIFYKTAIASNQNSTLIFEEPEAHAFPPYIVHITQEIIDSVSNQFVLSTHSPYILNYFLENAMDELAIFMVDYKNGKTVANKLSEKDMKEILEYGIDLFTNYETFLK